MNISLRIIADSQQAEQALDATRQAAGRLRSGIESISQQLARTKAELVSLVAGVFSIQQLRAAFTSVVQATIAQENALAQVEARLRSTGGAAGVTIDALTEVASALQAVSTYADDAILEAQALLLTFTNIRGERFHEATRAVLDLAAALGTDLKTAVLQVGKALNEPSQALSALQRSGTQFSAEQERVIKALAESGRLAEAQGLILAELNRQYGGAAEAARNTLGGALTALRNAFSDLLEVEQGLPAIRAALDALTQRLTDPAIKQGLQRLFARMIELIPDVLSLIVRLVEAVARFSQEIGAALTLASKLTPVLLAAFGAKLLTSAVAYTTELVKQIALKTILIARTRELTQAQAEGFAAANAELGHLAAGLRVALATLTGWQIGKWLRAEFLEARIFGIAMIEGLMVLWERMKFIAIAAWETIKAAALGALNAIRSGIAAIVGTLAEMVDVELFGKRLVGGTADSLRSLADQIRPAVSAYEAMRESIGKAAAERDRAIAAIREETAAMADLEFAEAKAEQARTQTARTIAQTSAAMDGMTASLRIATSAAKDHVSATKSATQAIEALDGILARQASELGGPIVAAAIQYRDRLIELQRIEQTLAETGRLGSEQVAQLARARAQAAEIYQRAIQAAQTERNIIAELLGELDDEIRLRQMSTRARLTEEAIIRAVNEAKLEGIVLSEEEIALLREGVTQRLAQLEAIEHAQAVAADYQRTWQSAIDGVAQAIGQWVTRGIKSVSDLGRAMRDILRRTLADIIAMFIRNAIILRIGAVMPGLGAMLMPAAAAAAGTGTALAAGAAGIGLGSALTAGLGAAWGGLGGLLTLVPGLGGVGLGMGVTAATVANMGLIGGLTASAQFGLANLAAGNIGLGLGALAGPIAALVAVASIINAISGGRLFGTRFRPESLTQVITTAGEASEQRRDVRQRSLFRGRQWRTVDITSDETRQAAQELAEAVAGAMREAARLLAGQVPPIIDGAIRTVIEYDNKGQEKRRRILVEVLGRTWEEATLEAARSRLVAEGIIATIDAILGGVVRGISTASGDSGGTIEDAVDEAVSGPIREAIGSVITKGVEAVQGEASAIAERWRNDAQTLLDGARMLLAAAVDIRRGSALLGDSATLTATTAIVERLRQHGESLEQTYQRLKQATELYEQALALMGQSWQGAREALVEHAAAIAEAAGGIERATQLWQRYFQTFYSEGERLEVAIAQARSRAAALLAPLGMTVEEALTGFRAAFEAALPNLSPEQIAAWLEAAGAIADLIELENRRAEALAEQARALAEYQSIVDGLRDELADAGLTEFQREMRAIDRWVRETTEAMHAAARAAGLQAAREEDLALVHQVAAARAAAAISRLEGAARDIARRLYGTPLERVERRIREVEEAQRSLFDGMANGVQRVSEASERMFEQQLRAIQSIRDWLDQQRLDPNLSSLTPEQRLAEARRQLLAAAEAARGGDLEAMQRLPQLATQFLRELRAFWASGEEFSAGEAWVRALLEEIASLQPQGSTGGGGGGGMGGGGGGRVEIIPSPELEALYAERERLIREAELQSRREMATELAGMIRELIQATGDTLEDIASRIGVSIDDLVRDLGISLDEMTVETAVALARVAAQLGVDLAELGRLLGVELGELADRQSLLNQALDATIQQLPPEFRDRLLPPLEALRSAVTSADANAAIEQLRQVTSSLPPGIRDLLAPFFHFLDPAPIVTQLTSLASIAETAREQLMVLHDILDAIRSSHPEPQHGYATGTAFVSQTGPAMLHRGEAVLPASVADWMRREGLPINAQSDSVAQRLDALIAITERRLEALERAMLSVAAAEQQSSDRLERALRQPALGVALLRG